MKRIRAIRKATGGMMELAYRIDELSQATKRAALSVSEFKIISTTHDPFKNLHITLPWLIFKNFLKCLQ